ncbi:MAG: hypothetical protein IKN54_02765, partial [Lachnospiraceae bacterium]|nr:hypothetical protein [Lachnospiraceae bacterium]
LTNGGRIEWNSKVFNLKAESDDEEELKDVVSVVKNQIDTLNGSYGIGVSSFRNGKLGYDICIVVVY